MQATSIRNVVMAGDWVKGVEHGANGLSQERAYVTGLQAANLVVERLGAGQQGPILQVCIHAVHKVTLNIFQPSRTTFSPVALFSVETQKGEMEQQPFKP